ncbi:vWA domain-containing protein [Paraburkholderia rhizosphaerae]|uniref:vWA domain-containing protein n=1 Tax=Paraburkholderia rhizosphaerae TaxID=480658 RepID=UPI001FB884C4|nr:vWA domain-containing protein [Paraburkholderia rhizosphaerae]
MRTTSKKRQQGAVSIVVVLSLTTMLMCLGLALDAGLGYMVKAKLDAAADGAAIAAGQSVTRGNTPDQQKANAQQAATAFFAANYPSGFLNSTATLQTPSVVFNNGTVTIDIAAQARVPTTFMQLIGYKSLSVATSSESIRRDLDMAFVVDTTTSMNNSTVQKAVRASSIDFLNSFDITNDRVALMHFATGTVVDVPFKNANARGFDRATMTTKINGYSFNGNTNSEEAMWNARWQLNHVITQPSSLRVIVFFSDGAPNSFSSTFPMTKSSCTTNTGTVVSSDDPPTGSGQTDNPGGLYQLGVQTSQAMSGTCYDKTAATVDHLPANYNAHAASEPSVTFPIVTNSPRVVTQAMNGASYKVRYQNINRASRNLLEAMAAQARSEGIYVFALGYGSLLTVGKGADGEKGEDILKCIANVADGPSRCYNPKQPVGVYCYAATANDIKPCYSQLASQILRISK